MLHVVKGVMCCLVLTFFEEHHSRPASPWAGLRCGEESVMSRSWVPTAQVNVLFWAAFGLLISFNNSDL